MARRKKSVRTDADYIASAKKLSKFVPKLKKYHKRKKLNRYERSAITRREKQLRFVADKLFVLTKKQAKQLKGKLYAPGVQAVELSGFSKDAKIKVIKKDTYIYSNGRTWLMWGLDRETVRQKRGMKTAAANAFAQKYPIETVTELARLAFKKLKPIQVNLWAAAGVVGQPFDDLKAFTDWVDEKWSAGRYISDHGYSSDPGAWINGIAILIKE